MQNETHYRCNTFHRKVSDRNKKKTLLKAHAETCIIYPSRECNTSENQQKLNAEELFKAMFRLNSTLVQRYYKG